MIADSDVCTDLKQWVVSQGRTRVSNELTYNSNLVKEGYIDSLGMMSLIAYVEKILGGEIPEELMSFKNFETIGKIHDVFFASK